MPFQVFFTFVHKNSACFFFLTITSNALKSSTTIVNSTEHTGIGIGDPTIESMGPKVRSNLVYAYFLNSCSSSTTIPAE